MGEFSREIMSSGDKFLMVQEWKICMGSIWWEKIYINIFPTS